MTAVEVVGEGRSEGDDTVIVDDETDIAAEAELEQIIISDTIADTNLPLVIDCLDVKVGCMRFALLNIALILVLNSVSSQLMALK